MFTIIFMKKLILFVLVFTLGFVILPRSVSAFEFRSGDNVLVTTDATISGTLMAAGKSIEINGTVDGDLICVGQSVTINGSVNGDVICAGQSVSVFGTVDGNVRLAGQTVTLEGQVERNGTIFGQTVFVTANGQLNGELLSAGQRVDIEGIVGSNAHLMGETVVVGGLIAGNLSGEMNELSFTEGAAIGGNVTYMSPTQVVGGDVASISGTMERKEPIRKMGDQSPDKPQRKIVNAGFGNFVWKLVTTLVFGLLLVLLFPLFAKQVVTTIDTKMGKSMLAGFLLFVATPFVVLFLILTLIGIPVAILYIMVFAVLIAVSRLFVALYVGEKVVTAYWPKRPEKWLPIVVGVMVTSVVFSLPLLGWLASMIAVTVGSGAIIMSLRARTTKK